ncbi:hypothetical protein [Reichenbachiella agariperforans]|uniref:hypothetical protein n=1 Tax=Reichenbachiella agariperforans TaxID=156994 RepID=UPI001C084D21|nr:hypothetical protein [Reichenbachiella agariperforans]MBU2916126.1 hypothetical protein [Reichenbachiella agariperforans]
MPKEKIAIISLLKPVDDIRSYHKLAKSIAKSCPLPIHLIGYPSKAQHSSSDTIIFHPSKNYSRLSLPRFIQPWVVFKKLLKLRPKLVIINSPELLPVTIVCQIIFGTKTVYDIQENYYRNLWHQQIYPPVVKHLFAWGIRLIETVSAPFISHFILAEKCYANELPFLRNRYTVLENKALKPDTTPIIREGKTKETRLLFSGTISENTGVKTAIELVKILNQPHLHLEVIGHCSNRTLYEELLQIGHQWLSLNISLTPLPYREIQAAISRADVGVVSYRTNPSNVHCMPTKVYEYAANGLAMLYETGSYWSPFIQAEGKGLALDFNKPEREKTLAFLTEVKQQPATPSAQALWVFEESKLMNVIKQLLN